ncbi:MAG: hypothetical protein ABH884_00575 [Candidatus Komeilibacteria bacterium]
MVQTLVRQDSQIQTREARRKGNVSSALEKIQKINGIVIIHEPGDPGEPDRQICGKIDSLKQEDNTMQIKFSWQAEKIAGHYLNQEPEDLILNHLDCIETIPIGNADKICLFNRHADENPCRIVVLAGKGDSAYIEKIIAQN